MTMMAGHSSSRLLGISKHISSFVRYPCSLLSVSAYQTRGRHVSLQTHLSTRPLTIECSPKVEDNISDLNDGCPATLRQDVKDIFKGGVWAALPANLLKDVISYQARRSTLTVCDRRYKLNNNVYVVGMGSAALGMAAKVEEVLGKHVVGGVISIPHSITGESLMPPLPTLGENTKLQVHEGVCMHMKKDNAISYDASKAILRLVSNLTEKDILIVLISGGRSSVVCPLPSPPITPEELNTVQKVLSKAGASTADLNTVLSNIDILNGGGLAIEAQPAKIVSLIMSSVVGDPVALIAGGPTYPAEHTPNYSLRIIENLGVTSKIPASVKTFLEDQARLQQIKLNHQRNLTSLTSSMVPPIWKNIQNVIVGNNRHALEGAAQKACELGYFPIILPEVLKGEAKHIGTLCAKLAKYVMMCLDSKSSEPNDEMAILEVELVALGLKNGITKNIINFIEGKVITGQNLERDICIIAGSDLKVHVKGNGLGGKNIEAAVAAAEQMRDDFRGQAPFPAETGVCLLCANTDGHDALTEMAGALTDQDFLQSAEDRDLNLKASIENNDTFSLLREVDDGKFLVETRKTGTDVMDMVVMVVRRPRDRNISFYDRNNI